MKTYLVGGAVRDKQLGLPIKDRDWVVVGATVEEMLALGFQQIGRDFPVFLHPETKEEYALARTERKTAAGYKGFEVHASPDITLEQDLLRRDLTINAMAEDEDGKVVDPYGGLADLNQKVLRHVSPAFVEDPLRVLRVARFASRFADTGFSIADETRQLMIQIAMTDEIEALVAERVWVEISRALEEQRPEVFFDVLDDCGVLQKLLPEIAGSWRRFGGEAENKKLPLRDILAALKKRNADLVLLFASLFVGAEQGVAEAVCKRFRVPSEVRDLARLTQRFHNIADSAPEPTQLLDALMQMDVLRRPDRFKNFIMIITVLDQLSVVQPAIDRVPLLKQCAVALGAVDAKALRQQYTQQKQFLDMLRQQRVAALQGVLSKATENS